MKLIKSNKWVVISTFHVLISISECNQAHTPLESRCKLKKESHPSVSPTTYQSLMGSLRYLTHTRPDLLFSVGYLSRYMENLTTEHMSDIKRIWRYLKGTLDLGYVYEKNIAGIKLVGYSDCDYPQEPDNRKSTMGMNFFLGNKLICWSLKNKRSWPCHHENPSMSQPPLQLVKEFG